MASDPEARDSAGATRAPPGPAAFNTLRALPPRPEDGAARNSAVGALKPIPSPAARLVSIASSAAVRGWGRGQCLGGAREGAREGGAEAEGGGTKAESWKPQGWQAGDAWKPQRNQYHKGGEWVKKTSEWRREDGI